MNAETSSLRSTATTSNDIAAIWPGALLSVYLAATTLVMLAGRERVAPRDVAVQAALLAIVAAATWLPGAGKRLRVWLPLLTVPALYAQMPAVIAAAGHAGTFDAVVVQWEQSLFNSQPAFAWARLWPSAALSELLHAAYLAYYGIIFAVPLAAARFRPAALGSSVFVVLFTFVACFVVYLFFPVAGPRYYWTPGSPDGPLRRLTLWILESGSSRGTAFPSSHVAVAVTQSLLALRLFGRKGSPILAVSMGLALGAVYGGFHYAIDVVAGVLYGVFTAVAGWALVRRLAGVAASPQRQGAGAPALRERHGTDVAVAAPVGERRQ